MDTERSKSPSPAKKTGAEDPAEWRAHVLYHHRVRSQLSNERKYVGWLRLSLALVALGFVVERLDLFLARATGADQVELTPLLRWGPVIIFSVGVILVVAATCEFAVDRRRIVAEVERGPGWLVPLVTAMVTALAAVGVLLTFEGLP